MPTLTSVEEVDPSSVRLELERKSTTSEDVSREEMPWETRTEILLRKWIELCESRANQHDAKGKLNKNKFRFLGVLTILLPTVFGGITQVFPLPTLVAMGFISSGVLSGVSALFNFGGNYIEHMVFAAKYVDLARNVTTELIKRRRLRLACDVFLKSTEMALNALTTQAPDI